MIANRGPSLRIIDHRIISHPRAKSFPASASSAIGIRKPVVCPGSLSWFSHSPANCFTITTFHSFTERCTTLPGLFYYYLPSCRSCWLHLSHRNKVWAISSHGTIINNRIICRHLRPEWFNTVGCDERLQGSSVDNHSSSGRTGPEDLKVWLILCSILT